VQASGTCFLEVALPPFLPPFFPPFLSRAIPGGFTDRRLASKPRASAGEGRLASGREGGREGGRERGREGGREGGSKRYSKRTTQIQGAEPPTHKPHYATFVVAPPLLPPALHPARLPTQLLHRPRALNTLVRTRARHVLVHCSLLSRKLNAAEPLFSPFPPSSFHPHPSLPPSLLNALVALVWELEMCVYYQLLGGLSLTLSSLKETAIAARVALLLVAWRSNHVALLQLATHAVHPHTVFAALARGDGGRRGGGREASTRYMLEEEACEAGSNGNRAETGWAKEEGKEGGKEEQEEEGGGREEDPLQSLACAVHSLSLASRKIEEEGGPEDGKEGGKEAEFPEASPSLPPSAPPSSSSSSLASFSSSLRHTLFGGTSRGPPPPSPPLRPPPSRAKSQAPQAPGAGDEEGGREGGREGGGEGGGLMKGQETSKSLGSLHPLPPARKSGGGRPPRPVVEGGAEGGGIGGGGGGGKGVRSLTTTPLHRGHPGGGGGMKDRFWDEGGGGREGGREVEEALGPFARAPGWEHFRCVEDGRVEGKAGGRRGGGLCLFLTPRRLP
jgi:hypothetical protein